MTDKIDKENQSPSAAVPLLGFDWLAKNYVRFRSEGVMPQELTASIDQKVAVRGFLHPASSIDAGWVLAAEPNLKSCCVGKADKRGWQIAVYGYEGEKPLHTAITLQGKLGLAMEVQGPFYSLENPSRIEDESSFSSLAILVLLVLVLGALGWYQTSQRKRIF